jgi:lysophospholipase L1-like esterase
MASIARAVWLAARNIRAALALLASGAHPSFAQIVAFGASNTAGYGVGSGKAWPARLEASRSPMQAFLATPRVGC